jgi:hypothetical protein
MRSYVGVLVKTLVAASTLSVATIATPKPKPAPAAPTPAAASINVAGIDSDSELAKAIDGVGKALEKNKSEQDALVKQQTYVTNAVNVVGLQIAAVAARQLSLEDMKKLLDAKKNVLSLEAQIANLANEKASSGDAKKAASLNKQLASVNNSMAQLSAQAAKSRDAADAAFFKAARAASDLSPNLTTSPSPTEKP